MRIVWTIRANPTPWRKLMFRIEWSFADGSNLVRLVRGSSVEAIERAAMKESYYRGIFRRAGKYTRSTSAFEYMDHFPVPVAVSVTVEKRFA